LPSTDSGRHLYGIPQPYFKFHPAFDAVLLGLLE